MNRKDFDHQVSLLKNIPFRGGFKIVRVMYKVVRGKIIGAGLEFCGEVQPWGPIVVHVRSPSTHEVCDR